MNRLTFVWTPMYLIAGIALWCVPAAGQLLTFDLNVPGDERVLIADSLDLAGTQYVSLPSLVEQAGGAYNLLPTRIRVDYKSTTAWLTLDDVRVHALSIFSLAHPVRGFEEDVAIAAADVRPFFLKAFRTPLTLRETVEESPLPDGLFEPDDSNSPQDPELELGLEALLPGETPKGSEGPVRVIVLDPGHGGYDLGIEGVTGYTEKELCLDIALRLAPILEDALSQDVVLTRREDMGLPVGDRLTVAGNSGGDLLVSIHAGGALLPRTSGIALYYGPPSTRESGLLARRSTVEAQMTRSSRTLAHAIASALTDATETPLRGVHAAPVRLLKNASMPSVMVEVGCLTSPTEEARLQTESHREAIARGIARGILAYLSGSSASVQASTTDGRVDTRRSVRN